MDVDVDVKINKQIKKGTSWILVEENVETQGQERSRPWFLNGATYHVLNRQSRCSWNKTAWNEFHLVLLLPYVDL